MLATLDATTILSTTVGDKVSGIPYSGQPDLDRNKIIIVANGQGSFYIGMESATMHIILSRGFGNWYEQRGKKLQATLICTLMHDEQQQKTVTKNPGTLGVFGFHSHIHTGRKRKKRNRILFIIYIFPPKI